MDQISEGDIGAQLKIAGWVENIRDHGGVSFIDLRDMYGVMQVVLRDTSLLDHVRKEECLSVEGVIQHRDVSIIEEPVAAAIGAGIDIAKPCGNMIVDIGGGTADIAVISLGGVVVSNSIKVAGDDFDEAIVRFMRKKHNLLIGERTAEDIKINVGTVYKRPENLTMDVRGRNLVTGLPKTVTVTSEETEEALREPAYQIVDAVHNVLERTPPELAADISDRGIVLTGGGSLIQGLEELIEEKTGINTMTAEDPLTAVAIGTGKYIEYLADDDKKSKNK